MDRRVIIISSASAHVGRRRKVASPRISRVAAKVITAYSIGACVGRGSVVGVGSVVGSGVGCVAGFGLGSVVGFGVGAGDGEGDGVTVFGPALLSATRALSPGKNKATKTITAIAAKKNGAMLAIHIGGVRAAGSVRSRGW